MMGLPFAPDDPIYGRGENNNGTYRGIPLGSLRPSGETHLLIAPLSQLMRLRHNPFFGYLEQRVVMEIDIALAGSGE